MEDVELQSKCANSARVAFEAEYKRKALTNYTNHYNRELGTCLMRVTIGDVQGTVLFDTVDIKDVYEHRSIAHFFSRKDAVTHEDLTLCNIADRSDCTKDEFDRAAKTLMSK